MNRVICLGNGESRLGIDLDGLRQYATIWGCNALYRDWTPDRLVCVDIEMCHEIYRSGYAFKNVVYFRDWNRLPGEAYDDIVVPSHISQQDIIELESYIHVSPRVEGWNEFAIGGQDLDQLRELREDYLTACHNEGIEVNSDIVDILFADKRAGLWVTWVAPEDKVQKTESLPGGSDYGFSSGPLCTTLASVEPETEEIYLLGMDLYSNTEKPNNVYKGTDCYIGSDGKPIPPDNWIEQYRMIFEKFPHIKYYKVNPKPLSNDKKDRVNTVIKEWSDTPNLEYITQDEMYKRFH